jgi:putative transposase
MHHPTPPAGQRDASRPRRRISEMVGTVGQEPSALGVSPLIGELNRLAAERAYPAVLRCDNGPELACAAMADWAGDRVGLCFIPPGEPWRNGYVESFNSRIRDECLNINVFWSLAQARVVISDWKREYNWLRPHSALNYEPPARYAATCTHQ